MASKNKHHHYPAFPVPDYDLGLSKREYFAGLAMQATNLEVYADTYGLEWADKVAKDSVLMADALLAELDKQIDNE